MRYETLVLKRLTSGSGQAAAAEAINLEAFPDNEHVEINELIDFSADDGNEVLGLMDGDTLLGFVAVLCIGRSVYIRYFAIDRKARGLGYGGCALRLLAERYPDRQVVADMETPDSLAWNAEQRSRRQAFYLRNGFRMTDLYMYCMDTEFQVAWSGAAPFDETDFILLVKEIEKSVDDFRPKIYHKPIDT